MKENSVGNIDYTRNPLKSGINGFDVLKFVMALMIVAIHTKVYNDQVFRVFFWPAVRCAVPVFFILSSFFYFKKQRANNFDYRKMLHFVKRICILYILELMILQVAVLLETSFVF